MWRRFKNIAVSLNSYSALSPDLRLRRLVNQQLLDRPSLDVDTWCQAFPPSSEMTHAVAAFVYETLADYSGLDFSRVRPDDRLEADLMWSQVCWFDWDLQLCDDFCERFHLDVSDRFYEFDPVTVADLIRFFDSLDHTQPSIPRNKSWG